MRAALLSFPLVLLGCVDDTPETLTVVVDANRARAQADQDKLAEMQRAVDEARDELVRTREDLTVLREKLVAAGAVTAEEAKKLEGKERALAAREAGLPAGSRAAGAAGLTRADVEALLQAQETRLAALLGGAPAPEAAPAAIKTDKGVVEALLTALARERDERGLHVGDLPRGRELLARAEAQLRAGRTDDALATAQSLGAEAAMTRVDLAFVQRKYARASGLLPALPGSAQGKAKALLAEANERVAAGDAVGASRKLTALLLLAE
ncbi:MAG: hypothetical protein HYS27_26345 [Deltaproteobacteria bacterium]|nr:hypothetical protein [Deltaproteobacteria bacterium]